MKGPASEPIKMDPLLARMYQDIEAARSSSGAKARPSAAPFLALAAAFFAYVFLAFTYVAAGMAIVLSPLASISYGLAGPTASVHVGDPLSYPLAPYMASLIVAENWEDSVGHGQSPKAVRSLAHIFREAAIP